ncbi:MAG: YceI family protein [Pseudomonadota bacterium]
MKLIIPFLLFASAAFAEPIPYALDRERSLVGFEVDLGGSPLKGNMPVDAANIVLDLDNLSRSSAEVTLNVSDAITEAGFATDAMLGGSVLDAARFPTIRFVSESISGTLSGGTVTGLVTIKGVTRPLTLDAQVFRQRDTEEGDRSRLSVLLTGKIDRRDFGADGFSEFVGPTIDIDILTRLTRQ